MLAACGDPPAVPDAGTGAPPDAGATDGGRRAFLTSNQYSGNLKAAGSAANSGYTGANTLCEAHAADAGLGGAWVAFVGSQTNPPASRVAGTGPWKKRLPDGGQTVVISAFASPPVSAIDVDERGGSIGGDVWSGRAGPGCSDWRSESGNGSVATPAPAAGTGWQNTGSQPCNLKFSLLCLEQ